MSRYNIVSTVFLILIIASLAIDGMMRIPLWWYIAVTSLFFAIVSIGVMVPSASFFVPVITKGQIGGIALTFDDGPVPNTEKVLDILATYDVPAAFFCIGNRVDAQPGLARRIDTEGHLIANHTYWHGAFFDLKSASMVSKELYDTDVAIMKATGRRPRFFRPPYGVTNPMVAKAVRRGNYDVIGWSVRSFDTVAQDPENLLERVTRELKPGDIILLHDRCDITVTILPRLLEHIRKTGLKIVRVDELINSKAYA